MQNKRKIRRRGFLKTAGALALLGGAILVYQLRRQEETYAQWYEQNIKNASGRKFAHPSLLREFSPSEEQKALLISELEKKIGKEYQIIKNMFYTGNSFLSLDVNEQVFREYTDKSRKAISEFFSFVGLAERIPDIEFHRLSPASKLDPPSEQKLPFHIALECFSTPLFGRYELDIKGRKVTSVVTQEENVGGEFTLSLNFYFGKDKIVLTSQDISAIVISAGINPIRSYNSPPAEALHYVLRKTAYRSIETDLNDFWLKAGKPNQLTMKSVNEATWEGIRREEGVVHAALNLFVESKAKYIGSSMDEITENLAKYGKEEHYKYIPEVRKLMEVEGCKNIVRRYLENPRLIFN